MLATRAVATPAAVLTTFRSHHAGRQASSCGALGATPTRRAALHCTAKEARHGERTFWPGLARALFSRRTDSRPSANSRLPSRVHVYEAGVWGRPSPRRRAPPVGRHGRIYICTDVRRGRPSPRRRAPPVGRRGRIYICTDVRRGRPSPGRRAPPVRPLVLARPVEPNEPRAPARCTLCRERPALRASLARSLARSAGRTERAESAGTVRSVPGWSRPSLLFHCRM